MKLLVMDVEGTLFKAKYKIDGTDYASTMWQPIAHALGEAAIDEERETHKKWDNLEYDNYSDWVKASIDIHRKYNLRKDDFNRLIELAEYNTGVEDFFQCLDRNEWIPVLISGGFQNLIRRAQRELDIEYGFGACEYYFNENDSFLEHYSLNASDFEGKISILNTLLKEFGLNQKTDWVFIGDGKNDEPIAKKAPLAFGINPHEKLKNVEGLIQIESFMDILNDLEKFTGRQNKILTEKDQKKKKPSLSNDDISKLNRRIMELKQENRNLKQKYNDLKTKVDRKENRVDEIKISETDYLKTPVAPLYDLLKGIRVTFLGLGEHYESYRRLTQISELNVISSEANNFDSTAIQNSDFLFIYKNCISHSAINHALEKTNSLPCCFLAEHTNKELLENAMANVLCRYIHGENNH
jgi:phosphoserine phosphatase